MGDFGDFVGTGWSESFKEMAQHAYAAPPLSRSPAPLYVVSEAERGFSVYSPDDPKTLFLVRGTPAAPTCTCPDFINRPDPRDRCDHINAVFGGRGGNAVEEEIDPVEAEERRAIQEESGVSVTAPGLNRPHFPSDLTIKRSISPDGRIDSLSVELSCPVHEAEFEATMGQASIALSLQEAIVKSFLAKQGSRANGNGQPHGNGNGHTQTGEGTPVPATILKIDGMQTRSGWRMYLAFNVEGKQLKLFGDKQHLCDALTGAGYRHHPNDIYPDMEFNLPCRVVTEMSKDGKYQNIVKVMSDRYTGGQR